MRFHTRYASRAALAAGLVLTLAGAELSGALAQPGNPVAAQTPALAAQNPPIFVSQEVVQPLPPAETPTPSETPPPAAASLRELVALTDSSGALTPDLECLAQAIYFEARGEPLLGQLAVAEVIINRSRSGRFRSTYCGVVRQPGQFSFVRKGAIPQARRTTRAWRNAVAIARIAHHDQWQSDAGEALYFHARYVRPGWSQRKQALATIDSHVFYR